MIFAAEVKSYDEVNNTFPTEYLIVCGDSFAEAAKEIEEYYGPTLESVALQYLESGDQLVQISKEQYKEFIENA